jgi:tetratricopeptide (TPR) repeat protein
VPINEGALAILPAAGAMSSVSAQNSAAPSAFQRILHIYRTGRAEDAIGELVTWPVDELAAAATTATASLSSSDHMAAAILEAEVTRALLAVHRPKETPVVIESALTLLHDAGRAPFGEKLGAEPRRSWYYAVTSALAGSYRTTEASALLELGEKEFHDDPLLITARGTISEHRWDVINFGNGHSIRRTEALMDLQAKAIADYKRALQLRPDLTVAKLRLAQLYVESGQEHKAASLLQSVTAGAATDNEQYFAHLLLGRIASKEHRLEAADAEYRKAYTIGRYQAACIAVSQLEEVLDRGEPPAAETEDCLRESERDDPWLSWRTKADPDALPHLRAEARGE